MKIQKILKQPENKSLEFKKEIPKNRQNLLKTVVAFANGSGGHIHPSPISFSKQPPLKIKLFLS